MSSTTESANERPILVTGFGPFGHHAVNASWSAVRGLKDLGVEHNAEAVPLEVREIPVAYDIVSSVVPQLYDKLKPRMCVHVGVSPYNVVKLEKCGRNKGYSIGDIHGRAPPTAMCDITGPDCIETSFKVDSVCSTVSKKLEDVTFEVSSDAGRYLCDFIYYTSLNMQRAPVLFVHVPELNKPYSVEQLSLALKHIVESLLDQMNSGTEV